MSAQTIYFLDDCVICLTVSELDVNYVITSWPGELRTAYQSMNKSVTPFKTQERVYRF